MADATQQRLSLINEAFHGLKQLPIQSFDDELEGVDDIERKYLTTVSSVLTHPSFPYSVERVQMARQTAAAGAKYNYTSPIGGDIMGVYAAADARAAHTDYAMRGGKVNTDLEAAWADVLVGAEPDSWAPYVREMVRACLEAQFAYDLTGDIALSRYKMQIAYGGPGEYPDGGLVGAARKRASQQQGGGVLTMAPNELTMARYR